MKLKWFFFTPQPNGVDIIVRDTGADNGDVLAEVSIRDEDFKKFVDEVLFAGLSKMNLPTPEPSVKIASTSKDWTNEPSAEEDKG